MPRPSTTEPTAAARAARTPRKDTEPQQEFAPLESRTRLELFQLATELGIAGRGDMSKAELIEAIRRR